METSNPPYRSPDSDTRQRHATPESETVTPEAPASRARARVLWCLEGRCKMFLNKSSKCRMQPRPRSAQGDCMVHGSSTIHTLTIYRNKGNSGD